MSKSAKAIDFSFIHSCPRIPNQVVYQHPGNDDNMLLTDRVKYRFRPGLLLLPLAPPAAGRKSVRIDFNLYQKLCNDPYK